MDDKQIEQVNAKLAKSEQLMQAQAEKAKKLQQELDAAKNEIAKRDRELLVVAVKLKTAEHDETYKGKFNRLDAAVAQMQVQVAKMRQQAAEANERARQAEMRVIELTSKNQELENGLFLLEQSLTADE